MASGFFTRRHLHLVRRLAPLVFVTACAHNVAPRDPPRSDERRVEERPKPVEEEDPTEPPEEHRAPFPAFGNKVVKPDNQVKKKPRYTRARQIRSR